MDKKTKNSVVEQIQENSLNPKKLLIMDYVLITQENLEISLEEKDIKRFEGNNNRVELVKYLVKKHEVTQGYWAPESIESSKDYSSFSHSIMQKNKQNIKIESLINAKVAQTRIREYDNFMYNVLKEKSNFVDSEGNYSLEKHMQAWNEFNKQNSSLHKIPIDMVKSDVEGNVSAIKILTKDGNDLSDEKKEIESKIVFLEHNN